MKNLNLDSKATRYVGFSLVIAGFFALVGMWWMLPVVILASVGGYVYTERRKEGRIAAAVQSGLWLIGLAVLWLFSAIIFPPGILVLAGASLLIRGHEPKVDERVREFLAKIGIKLAPAATTPAPVVAASQPAPNAAAGSTPGNAHDDPTAFTGETTRL